MISFLSCILISSQAIASSEAIEITEKIVDRYTQGWSQGSGTKFASDFATDAEFVNIFGMQLRCKDCRATSVYF